MHHSDPQHAHKRQLKNNPLANAGNSPAAAAAAAAGNEPAAVGSSPAAASRQVDTAIVAPSTSRTVESTAVVPVDTLPASTRSVQTTASIDTTPSTTNSPPPPPPTSTAIIVSSTPSAAASTSSTVASSSSSDSSSSLSDSLIPQQSTTTAIVITSAPVSTSVISLAPTSSRSSTSTAAAITALAGSNVNAANSNSGISSGGVVGIVAAALLAVVLLGTLIGYMIRKKRRDRELEECLNIDLFSKSEFRRESVLLDDRNFMTGGDEDGGMDVQDYHGPMGSRSNDGHLHQQAIALEMAEYRNGNSSSGHSVPRSNSTGSLGRSYDGHYQAQSGMGRSLPGSMNRNGDLSNPRAPSMFVSHHQQQRNFQQNQYQPYPSQPEQYTSQHEQGPMYYSDGMDAGNNSAAQRSMSQSTLSHSHSQREQLLSLPLPGQHQSSSSPARSRMPTNESDSNYSHSNDHQGGGYSAYDSRTLGMVGREVSNPNSLSTSGSMQSLSVYDTAHVREVDGGRNGKLARALELNRVSEEGDADPYAGYA